VALALTLSGCGRIVAEHLYTGNPAIEAAACVSQSASAVGEAIWPTSKNEPRKAQLDKKPSGEVK